MGVKQAAANDGNTHLDLLENQQQVNDCDNDDEAPLIKPAGSLSPFSHGPAGNTTTTNMSFSRKNVCAAAGCILFLVVIFQLALDARWRINTAATAEQNKACAPPPQDPQGQSAAQVENNEQPCYPGATTFVFTLGLEGTGHHFLAQLVSGSPSMKRLRKDKNAYSALQGIKTQHISGGLMAPVCMSHATTTTPAKSYNQTVHLLQDLHGRINGTMIPFVSVNTYGTEPPKHMLSYPDGLCAKRTMYPSMDIFHRACQDARVNGAMVYLYRDPYAVLASTTLKRHFQDDMGVAIHLYTMALHIIEAQLLDYPSKVLGCFGFYDVNATEEELLWEPIGNMFGWKDETAYRRYVKDIYRQPHLMSQAEKEKLVPQGLEPSMREFMEGHKRVLRICREQAKLNQPQWGLQ